MKYSIPLALFAAVRTFANGVNAEFTVIPRSLICPHFVINLPSASSERTRRLSGGPPIDRVGLYLHLTEGPIYDTNEVLVKLTTSAHVAGFLER